VVVVHGFTGNPVSVRPLGQALAARGYAVDVPRLPGHGTHWRDLARTGYVDWRQAVDEAVTAMRPRVERLALVGLSMGGFLCLDAGLARQDDVDGVVSINAPFLDREGIVGRLAPFIARIIPSLPPRRPGWRRTTPPVPASTRRPTPRCPPAPRSRSSSSFRAFAPPPPA
jgi:carboxylesterase